jgi:hypothetical protein
MALCSSVSAKSTAALPGGIERSLNSQTLARLTSPGSARQIFAVSMNGFSCDTKQEAIAQEKGREIPAP